MRWRVRPATLHGAVSVPGDKSIAHRALMLAALAQGSSTIRGLPSGEDVLNTVSALRTLGVTVRLVDGVAHVSSTGRLTRPTGPIYTGNSGTTMRLLAGILAGQPFRSRLEGDASLSRRPMKRIVEPLTRMGASIHSRDGRAPLDIHGGSLHGIHYVMPVASAQVKSCLLLAGLFARGETCVVEPVTTRDHTERMLRSLGIRLEARDHTVGLQGGQRPQQFHIEVPGDISSAAFFLAGAVLSGGAVEIGSVGVNPTRLGFLRVLERLGARVAVHGAREQLGEPIGNVSAAGRVCDAIEVGGAEIPLLVDELPLVALLATQAPGTTIIRDAGELRVKETDRIEAVVQGLRAFGGNLDELTDGFTISGPSPLHGATVHARGDHRIAMMFALAGTIASGETIVEGAEASAVSFPGFERALTELGGAIVSD